MAAALCAVMPIGHSVTVHALDLSQSGNIVV
jgi:hypothetical protein